MENEKKELLKLLKKDDIIVLGCSAGPDSMALLHVLRQIKKEIDILIVCAHVNHNVRKESKKELQFLEDYCKKNEYKFECMTIAQYGDDNFHNEARDIRYKFFEEIVNKYQANYLMTAHHGDDLMETVLMRIVRGSTLSGYSGFTKSKEKENYTILRPFITVSKDDIMTYNKKNKIPFATDKSNKKDTYTRNRYRKNVLPFLKKEDPNVHKKFLKYSNLLQLSDNYIEKQMIKEKNKAIKDNKLDIKVWKTLDQLFKLRIIYSMLEDYYQDDLILIADNHVNLIIDLINNKKSNSYIYMPNNVRVIKTYDIIEISRETDLIDSYEIELGQIAYLPNNKTIETISVQDKNDNNYCRLNLSDITLPLKVRTRKSGDKIKIKGMSGYKKVKDIFIDVKIPIKERDIMPIVVDAKEKIIWMPGIKKSNFDIPSNKKCDIILRYY